MNAPPNAIGYYTDNNVSHTVMKAFSRAGYKVSHIKSFYSHKDKPGIFYGILRGSGIAMRYLKAQGIDYWYVDNGYFDAQYMDLNKYKEMSGKFRIVKNEMIEVYNGLPTTNVSRVPLKLLVLPPSPYTAFMYDTTPEDWLQEWKKKCSQIGDSITMRDKNEQRPLNKQLDDYDGILTFNSMSIMTALKMGKAVYSTHGVIRNGDLFEKTIPYYNYNDLYDFYRDKQYTLEEIKQVQEMVYE